MDEHARTPHERKTQAARLRLRDALVAALFLACTAGLGLYDALARAADGPALGRELEPVPLTRAALLRGASARAAERALEQGSHAAAHLRPWAHDLQLLALGMASPAVELGRDGWLFLSEDVEHQHGARAQQRSAAAWMGAGALALRARGIECIALVVPDKASAYPERRPALARPPREDYQHGLAQLEAAGLAAPDLLTWMRAQPDVLFYRPDDTHWTIEGAARSADWLASHVLERAPRLAPPLAARTLVGDWNPTHFLGDHLRQLGLSERAPWTRSLRFGELSALVQFAQPVDARACELQLVGTSMSARQLRQQLARALDAAVGDFVQPGGTIGGQFAPLLELLASGEARETRIVVWEIVERYQRSAAAEHFRGLAPALARAWGAAWRELTSPGAAEPRARELACLLVTQPEGAAQVWEPERWLVARYELDWLLPGNGTFALQLGSTAEPGSLGAQRALLAPRLPPAGRCTEPVRAAAELALPLPLVAAAHTAELELALVGAPHAPWQPRLWSAWEDVRELQLPESARFEAGELVLELGAELSWDGLHALVLELEGTRRGELEWSAPGATSPAQRATLPVRERLRCVLPLAARSAGELARASRVRLRFLPAGEAAAPRVLGAQLWRLPASAPSAR